MNTDHPNHLTSARSKSQNTPHSGHKDTSPYSSVEIRALCVERTLPAVTLDAFRGKNADQHTTQLLDTLLSLVRSAEQDGRLLILTSGFVADFAEGTIQRPHHDLDLLVLESDFTWIQVQLADQGFSITAFPDKNPAAAFQAKREKVIVDVGAITVTAERVFDVTDTDAQPFTWPIQPSAFLWQRAIDTSPILFVNPRVISAFKQQAGRHSVTDAQDLAVLARHITD